MMTSLCVISLWCHHSQVTPRTTLYIAMHDCLFENMFIIHETQWDMMLSQKEVITCSNWLSRLWEWLEEDLFWYDGIPYNKDVHVGSILELYMWIIHNLWIIEDYCSNNIYIIIYTQYITYITVVIITIAMVTLCYHSNNYNSNYYHSNITISKTLRYKSNSTYVTIATIIITTTYYIIIG